MIKKLNKKVESVNNVNATAVVESKKISAKDILSNLQNETVGLLKTNLGTKKATIYKENIFENCSDKEKNLYAKNYVILFTLFVLL